MKPDLSTLFPITDADSARLMKLKAHCLFGAGIITAAQKARVDRAAEAVIGRSRADDFSDPRTVRPPEGRAQAALH